MTNKRSRHCTPGVLPQDGVAILQGAAKRGNLMTLVAEFPELPHHCVSRHDGVCLGIACIDGVDPNDRVALGSSCQGY